MMGPGERRARSVRDRALLAEREVVVRSCRGAAKSAVVVLLFLAALLTLLLLGGCETIYFPQCQYDCAAQGGSDSFGRGSQ